MCAWRPWPYAATAIIQHEWDTNLLNVWVVFRYPMDQDVKPAHGLWLCEADGVPKAITVSAWQDEWTILLTVPNVLAQPDRVTLEYDGPSTNLRTTWDKQWEPWGPILSVDLISYEKPSFVDRGDPTSWDWTQGTLTTDGTWRELDLSAIVPANATAAVIRVTVRDETANLSFAMRKKGNVNAYAVNPVRTQVSNIYNDIVFTVPIDTDRKIEYFASPTDWNYIGICIIGWFF